MENLHHPQLDEEFLQVSSKVMDLMEHLEVMINANKMEDKRDNKKKEAAPKIDITAGLTDKNYFVSTRSRRLGRSSSKRSKRASSKVTGNTSQFTFMRQIDQTEEQRRNARIERERIATNFRRMGNYEFRKDQFSTAIDLYTKGLEYIKDTPVLYCNRACCFIKQRNFKRAILDCNYVITNLDSKNLYAWLYRAFAYKRLQDEKNFNESIYQVKRLNFKDMEFIDTFLERMRTAF